jgi:DNA end-binding protein Ku
MFARERAGTVRVGTTPGMPRSIWNGSISFGLVNVPVQLFSAVQPKDVRFHEFQAGTGARIKHKRVSEKNGREIDYSDIEKGFETARGKYVMLTQEELESVEPGRSRTIDIEDFVQLAEIDPIYFDKSYYVAPQKGAEKPYALLREAMARSERVAIARFVMRTKQYLAAIRAADKVLVLQTLFFADEIRPTREIDLPARTKVADRELRIADQLIDSLTIEWKPDRYEDTYRERVLDLVRRKGKGQQVELEARPPEDAKVLDLVEALQRSLDARTSRSGSRKGKTPTAKRARQPATATAPAKATKRPAKKARRARAG